MAKDPVDVSVGVAPRSVLARLPQTAGVMEHLDPVHISKSLTRLGWSIDGYLARLIELINSSDDDPRLQLAAMRQLDSVIERSATLVLQEMGNQGENEFPLPETSGATTDLSSLANFLEHKKNVRPADESTNGASFHLPPGPEKKRKASQTG